MGYQGRAPVVGSFKLIDDITSQFNGAQTQFSLASSSTAVVPGSAQNLFISIGGVLQSPGNAYSVSGSTIVFSSAPANTQPFFGVLLGDALDVGYITSGVNINVGTITAAGNTSIAGTLTLTGGVSANGSVGTSGYVLTSNGTTTYWATGGTPVDDVTNILANQIFS